MEDKDAITDSRCGKCRAKKDEERKEEEEEHEGGERRVRRMSC